jgi:hypothetical protein
VKPNPGSQAMIKVEKSSKGRIAAKGYHFPAANFIEKDKLSKNIIGKKE